LGASPGRAPHAQAIRVAPGATALVDVVLVPVAADAGPTRPATRHRAPVRTRTPPRDERPPVLWAPVKDDALLEPGALQR
jgi:hypothetical protein